MLKRFGTALLLGGTLLGFGAAGPARATTQIVGAGSTFAYPLYSAWAQTYARDHGIRLNYQSIGSGGGIRQIEARTVDFGASDAPMKIGQLDAKGLVQFPTAMGGVIPTVNLPGVKRGRLVLDGKLLAEIYLGDVKKWNDPRIERLNPRLRLPDLPIIVVHRSDGSGTTFIFTNYLSKVSRAWKNKMGFGKAVPWPVGVGGKGNEGVAAYVQRLRGAIGYNEYAYVLQNKMNYARMANRAGHVVRPTARAFAAAAANADWKDAPGYYLILTNQPGRDSWPITGATFVLVPKHPSNPVQTLKVLRFFAWGFHHGTRIAEKLDYIPMPSSVVKLVEATWREQVKGSGGRPLWR